LLPLKQFHCRLTNPCTNVFETHEQMVIQKAVSVPRETKSRHAMKRGGSLLQLVDGLNDSGRFAVPACSVEAGC